MTNKQLDKISKTVVYICIAVAIIAAALLLLNLVFEGIADAIIEAIF